MYHVLRLPLFTAASKTPEIKLYYFRILNSEIISGERAYANSAGGNWPAVKKLLLPSLKVGSNNCLCLPVAAVHGGEQNGSNQMVLFPGFSLGNNIPG